MIKVKNIFEAVEEDDGVRLWVEPIGLTKDLQEWCQVEHLMPHLAPDPRLTAWFEEHPDGYDYFRGMYHTSLSRSAFLPSLKDLAAAAKDGTITLLHQGDDPAHNTGVALYEFLSEIQAFPSAQE